MRIYLLFFSFIISFTYSQQKITYTASLNTNFEKLLGGTSNNVKSKMIKMISENKDLDYVLKINDKESLFFLKEDLKSDAKKGLNMTKVLGGNGLFYKNLKTSEILNQKESLGEQFLISYPKQKWVLVNQTKMILGYQCYKATSTINVENTSGVITKKITAWYAPKLPYNFAPKQFSGLPGLVLELQEGRLTFKAKEIKLNLKENIQINKPTKGIEISLEKFNEMVKERVSSYKR